MFVPLIFIALLCLDVSSFRLFRYCYFFHFSQLIISLIKFSLTEDNTNMRAGSVTIPSFSISYWKIELGKETKLKEARQTGKQVMP